MPYLSRRAFAVCAAGFGAASLAGCAAQPSALAQIQNDTELLMAGLRSVLPALEAMPPSAVPPEELQALQTNIQEASLFAADIASAQSVAQTVTPVQSMAAALGDAVQTANKLHVPPQVRTVFAAAGALLPSIEAPSGYRLATSFYSADQARLILRQSASQAA